MDSLALKQICAINTPLEAHGSQSLYLDKLNKKHHEGQSQRQVTTTPPKERKEKNNNTTHTTSKTWKGIKQYAPCFVTCFATIEFYTMTLSKICMIGMKCTLFCNLFCNYKNLYYDFYPEFIW